MHMVDVHVYLPFLDEHKIQKCYQGIIYNVRCRTVIQASTPPWTLFTSEVSLLSKLPSSVNYTPSAKSLQSPMNTLACTLCSTSLHKVTVKYEAFYYSST